MAEGFSSVEGMTWWAYVQRHSAGAPNAHIARAVGITPPSVGRWSKPGVGPDPAQAAAFARAYGRPVLEAFIAAGFLTPDEAGERPSAPPSLASLDDDDLLDEVRRRMHGGSSEGRQPEDQKINRQDDVLPNLSPDDVALAARHGRKRGAEIRDELDKHSWASQDPDSDEPA